MHGYFGKVLAVRYLLDTPAGTAVTADPTNTTVLHGSTVSLNCSADANPLAYLYRFYLNDTIIGNSSSGLFNITVDADGVYTCVSVNQVGTGQSAVVRVTAVGEFKMQDSYSFYTLVNPSKDNIVIKRVNEEEIFQTKPEWHDSFEEAR